MGQDFKHAVVTGGAGFIGSHLVERLIKDCLDVTVIDDLSTGNANNLLLSNKAKTKFIKADITDPKACNNALKGAEVVFHQAAVSSVTSSFKDPRRTTAVNIGGTLNLLESSRLNNVEALIFASSAAVYGDSHPPCREKSCPKPLTPYAVTKLAAENLCHVYNELYGLKTIILRYFNVYGPRQRSDLEGGVIAQFLTRLREGRGPVIFGDGSNTRDFIHVQDVVEANILGAITPLKYGVFNIGTGKPTKILDLANLLSSLTGRRLQPEFTSPRYGDVKDSWCDTSRAYQILHFSAKINLTHGLKSLLDTLFAGSKK
ncbi:MAG: NAD-dependent epimerase/dehydratase family protein [Candidatus Bathyarchaeia archaeon]